MKSLLDRFVRTLTVGAIAMAMTVTGIVAVSDAAFAHQGYEANLGGQAHVPIAADHGDRQDDPSQPASRVCFVGHCLSAAAMISSSVAPLPAVGDAARARGLEDMIGRDSLRAQLDPPPPRLS